MQPGLLHVHNLLSQKVCVPWVFSSAGPTVPRPHGPRSHPGGEHGIFGILSICMKRQLARYLLYFIQASFISSL